VNNKQLTYFHDAQLIKDSKGTYFSTVTNNTMLDRYKVITNNIAVALRIVISDNVRESNQLQNIKVYEIPNPNTIRGLLLERYKIKRQIRDIVKNTDYVIARLPSTIGHYAVKYARKFNKRYLIEAVACPFDALWNHSLVGKILAPIEYIKMRSSVKNSKYSVYVTNNFLQNRYPTQGNNINISNVYLKRIDDNILNKRIDKINSSSPSKVILGTIGHLNVKYKGQHLIIKALSKLKKVLPEITFEYQIVGDGSKDRLLKLAKKYNVQDNVNFVGRLNHDNIFKWVDDLTIYVQPSRQEGLPRSVIEAMSRAVPTIGSNIAGIPELLNPNCIFNIKRNPVINFINVLKTFDVNKQIIAANENFDKSHDFDYSIIENRRTIFLKKFKSDQ